MPCNRDALSLFVDGELPSEEFQAVSHHLRSCSQCRAVIADMRRVNNVLYSWGSVRRPVPPETERSIRSSVERRRRLSPVFRLARFSPPAVGSSIAALLLLVTVNLGPLYQAASAPRPDAAKAAQLVKRQSAPLQLARSRAAVVTTQPDALRRLLVRRHIEALIN